jgi:hypothetical protein
MTPAPDEFIRRVLSHVLPKGMEITNERSEPIRHRVSRAESLASWGFKEQKLGLRVPERKTFVYHITSTRFHGHPLDQTIKALAHLLRVGIV